MAKRIFIIHGWGGSPEEGWRPWLKAELEKSGFKVYIPAMPDTNYPKLDVWLEALTKVVVKPDADCYFVGHSLGCITILRYLEKMGPGQKICGAVLVAGFSDMEITVGEDESVKEISSFFEAPIDFGKVKNHCNKFVAIHSDNDPYVPLRYGDIFKEKLGAEVVIKHNMSHFSGDDGISELPCVLQAVFKISE